MKDKNDCYVCKGEKPEYMSHRCEKHNICMGDCGRKRSKINSTPWGRKGGWICRECMEEKQDKSINDYQADNKNKNHEYDDKPICPWCGHEYYDDEYRLYGDDNEEDLECSNCESTFHCETYVSRSYTTVKLERFKKEPI